jgi:L-ascorbate metabolism protein UlaG (beta-lactamase superfamily)
MSGIGRLWQVVIVGVAASTVGAAVASSQERKPPEQDTIKTETGDLTITFVGHGSLVLGYRDKIVHVDPVSREGDYSKLPKADVVLITHEHGDHLDPKALGQIRKDQTKILLTKACAEKVPDGTVVKNGDVVTIDGFKIEAVPAYNIAHKRPDGQPFHAKGVGNGYVIHFDKTRVYVAGDTENIPEMANLKDIAIAFLPMNLPYTMTPEMAADAARMFQPGILYPYHYGETDAKALVELLKGTKIDVRIRKMK